MAVINSLVLTGRITKNAEMKVSNGGLPIVNFSIAVNERVHDTTQASGWGTRANFFDIVGFGNYYKAVLPSLTRGREVTIMGKLHQDRWEKDGQKYSRVCVYAEECEIQRSPTVAPGEANSVVRDTQAEMYRAQQANVASQTPPPPPAYTPQQENGTGEMIF